MSIHRGEIVKKQIIRSGMTKMAIAKRMRITRQTLDNWLKREDLEVEKIAQIGNIIQHDFSIEFPKLNELIGFNKFKNDLPSGKVEDEEINSSASGSYSKPVNPSVFMELETCKAAKEELMGKYVDLLERYNKLLAELKNH